MIGLLADHGCATLRPASRKPSRTLDGLLTVAPLEIGWQAIWPAMVSAALRQAFIPADRPSASQTLRHVADQLRGKWPKLGTFIDESEHDVLAHMDFPAPGRRGGIFPGEASIIRLIGAALLEASDEWRLQHRYLQTEVMAELTTTAGRHRSTTDRHRGRPIPTSLTP